MNLYEYNLQTDREGFYSITGNVQKAVTDSGVREGLCIVYCPHTTAGITVNENADPDVTHDMLLGLREAFPDRPQFRHAEGNSAAHLKASAVGFSQTLIVEGGTFLCGRWQGIWFCEFDGPRTRRYLVKVIGE